MDVLQLNLFWIFVVAAVAVVFSFILWLELETAILGVRDLFLKRPTEMTCGCVP